MAKGDGGSDCQVLCDTKEMTLDFALSVCAYLAELLSVSDNRYTLSFAVSLVISSFYPIPNKPLMISMYLLIRKSVFSLD